MIRVAIIGSGFGLYGLLPAFLATKGCKVVAICGKNTPRLLDYCEQVDLKNIYTSWEEMLTKEEIDALAIAVTPEAQYEIAQVALKKGIHIFGEKPLAVTLSQAKTLQSLAQKKKVTTGVDFIFPEIAEWKFLKNIIEKEKYGKLRHVSASWDFLSYDLKNRIATWKTDEGKGGGALAFFGSHFLHNLRFFVGDYTVSKSQIFYAKESFNGGDVGFDALFKTKSGINGNVHLCCNAKGEQSHTYKFIFEKATVILHSTELVTSAFELMIKTSKGTEVKKLTKKPKDGEDERVTQVAKLAKLFVNACRQKIEMYPSFTEGVYVQEQIEMIRKLGKV